VYIDYQYDVLNRLTLVKEVLVQPNPNYEWQPESEGGSYIARYSYNNLRKRARVLQGYSPDRGIDNAYSYETGSHLTKITRNLDGTETTNDSVLELTRNGAGQIQIRSQSNDRYAFTELSNVNRTYAVNRLNQYVEAGALNFIYDGRGNLVDDGTDRTYSYDARNRLKQMVKSGIDGYVVNLRYDPLGRLSQISGGPEGGSQIPVGWRQVDW